MKIKSLNAAEIAACEEPLNVFSDEVGQSRPIGLSVLQSFYDITLTHHQDNEDLKLVIGLAFGDYIASREGYEWVRVEDDYGEETALSPPATSLTVFPISMIQKRLNKEEKTDLTKLYSDTIALLREMIEDGNYDKR